MKNRLFLLFVLVVGTSFMQKASDEPLRPTVIAVAAKKVEPQKKSALSQAEFVRQNGLMYPQTCCDAVLGICWVSVVIAVLGGCFYAVSTKQN